ncbi:MAG: hypothetical protein DWQ34_13000 [Planctomycetota bacterium]|nr:MAG: hypothetical protein DWQ34_13000 [Planctomycetota bacterium]REK23189.1 MAG: hypothetical protein DWQ41_17325 [Planctomycetota bacterium]REK30893.1 MAG: hypothetical protein DWQ45_20865 [Planctomycetota bacterium]
MKNRKLIICLISIPVLAVGIPLLIVAAWFLIYFGFYIGLGNLSVLGHQEFAANGVAQIEPARQMEELFDDCRHSIKYTGRNSVSTWHAEAYFGGRYQLTMQVPVRIESSTRGEVTGEPKFYLIEVRSIHHYGSDGRPGATIEQGNDWPYPFSAEDWAKVYEAGGDFSVIGINLKTDEPVKGFDDWANAHPH